MRKWYTYSVVCFALLVWIGVSCKRRALEYEYFSGVLVRINIDWGNVVTKPDYVKILFYPLNNGTPVFRYIDPNGDLIRVPYGDYHVVLYNWRTNSDAQNVKFNDSDTYPNFYAYTDIANSKTFTSVPLFAQPDNFLYSWSSGSNAITINESNKALYSTDAAFVKPSDTITINTKPVNLVKTYSFHIPVDGLPCLNGAEAMISGVGTSVLLHNNQVGTTGNNLSVSLSPAKDGINCLFYTFGFTLSDTHLFKLNLILADGTVINKEFDLTNQARSGKITDFSTPISVTCTGGGGGFKDPGIGEWKESNQDINF